MTVWMRTPSTMTSWPLRMMPVGVTPYLLALPRTREFLKVTLRPLSAECPRFWPLNTTLEGPSEICLLISCPDICHLKESYSA